MRRHFRPYRRKHKYHSSRRRNNNAGALLLFVALSFVIGMVSKVVNFLTTNSDIIGRVFSVLFIMAIVGVITYVALKILGAKCTEYVNTHSVAINSIKNLNDRYEFKEIARMDLYHSYDNANFYGDISPEDYLIYQLSYNMPKVKMAIEHAEENKRSYESYVRELAAIQRVALDVPKCLAWYFRYKEECVFNDLVQHPVTEYDINVVLTLTKINGVFLDSKQKRFNSQKITCFIDGLLRKDGSFYSDRNIWDAICRVERGKVSNKMRFAIYERDGYRCRKCGSPNDLEVDHIFPIAKGGKTEFNNLQTLCHQCNLLKSDSVEHGTYDPKYDKKMHICPNCGIKLVLRNGRNGQFYGCPNYPNCRHTEKV